MVRCDSEIGILFSSPLRRLFPTVLSTDAGVDALPRNLVRMGQDFNLSRSAILRKMVLAGASPAIPGGFRITATPRAST